MDFFQHQDAARRWTAYLVLLFALAILCIVGLLYLVALAVAAYAFELYDPAAGAAFFWQPRLLLGVTVSVLVVVTIGSLYRVAQLRTGGETVAQSLGGRLLSADTTEPHERRLLNVVEEMAIASGTPVPPVYLLDHEGGINAFAAGWTPGDAAIGVTRGCIEHLSREQLQGVMAHEFSHILNGDMRMNTRLIGLIHGILVIGLIGYHVMRAGAASGGRSWGRSRKKGGNIKIIAVGAAVMAIGYLGTFFGRLIKAAVSRQREFLADASAVQFTRNPGGIAGALRRIGGYTYGSRVLSPRGEEVSHMFFGEGPPLSALFATHPPLPERIRRIDPGWDGQFPRVEPTARQKARMQQKLESLEAGPRAALAGEPQRSEGLRAAIDRIGRPTHEHVQHAAALIGAIPGPLRAATHEPHGAQAVVLSLLLSREGAARRDQLDRATSGAAREAVDGLLPSLEGLDEASRLPLLDMALPTLRRLSPEGYRAFRERLDAAILTDGRVSLPEWSLRCVVTHHLDPHFGLARPARILHGSLRPLLDPIACLLSTLAFAGHRSQEAAEAAFAAARRRLGVPGLVMRGPAACGVGPLDEAVDRLAQGSPGVKKRVIEACAEAVAHDAAVTLREAELFRALCAALDCPMPPLLPGQPLI